MSLIKLLKPVSSYAATVNFLVILTMVVLLVVHRNLPPKIPLWLSLDWGETRLAPPIFLWVLPLIAIFFFVSSYIFGKLLNKNYLMISQILVWTTAFLSFVFLLSIYKIILLVS